VHRTLMVRRWDPTDAARIAEIFAEHDRTDFPASIGVTRRTLFGFHDLYFHLIEADDGFRDRLFAAAGDGHFRTVDSQLGRLLTPYDAASPSMAQAEAAPFYDWRRP